MDAIFYRTAQGATPADCKTSEWLGKLKVGQVFHGKFTKMRNYQFHKKYMKMIDVAFEYWEPGEIDTQWGKPEKNKDVFRKQLQILAGYGEMIFNIDGTFRMQPKSISFANMDEEEFEGVYNSVLTVILDRVMINQTKEDFQRLLDFA